MFRLHRNASAVTLANFRIFIFLIWVLKLLSTDYSRAGYFDVDLFHAHGILLLIPAPLLAILTSVESLMFLRFLTLAICMNVVFGFVGKRTSIVFSVLLLTLLLGLAKGFGGHINHRELVLLYSSYILAFSPCFDARCIIRSKIPKLSAEQYRVYAIAVCSVIVFNYFLVGLARLCIGFPHVFHPDVMQGWIAHRTVRPNPYGFELGKWLLTQPFFYFILPFALPISTLVELGAPFILWARTYVRLFLVLSLMLFHIGIFFTMNISFIENVLLLSLLVDSEAKVSLQKFYSTIRRVPK